MRRISLARAAFVACLVALIAGNALAQSFPTKPITLICPVASGAIDRYLRSFAQVASKYLGQPVVIENKPGELGTLGPATARTARPDGYILSMFTIMSLRVPHMARVDWDPIKDFTYVIGLADFSHGVAVKSDSRFNTLKDLIDYAKANPGSLRYGSRAHGFTSHLVMEELGFKTGARLLRVPSGGTAEAAKALIDGRIMAISDTISELRADVESGAFRLLVTFGERRTNLSAPTATELGLDVLAYTPLGIVAPKGLDPRLTKLLHDAFNRALDDPEYEKLLTRLDMVDLYKSSEDYAEWAADQFKFQRALIERTIGLGRN